MIDIHESCAQLVAAGYNAVVDNEETDYSFSAIRCPLNEHFDLMAVYQHGEDSWAEGWHIYTVLNGCEGAIGGWNTVYVHNTDDDVCEAVMAYARQVGRDARSDTGFCARHAVLEHFGWDD